MRDALSAAQTLKTLWVPQHLAPLRGQRNDLRWHLVLPRHADVKHLLGFLPRGHTAQGRQAKRHATHIRRLTPPMARGHAAKRCDGIGADRHADVIQPACRGGLALEVKRGAQRLTQSGRGHGIKQRLALGAGVVREPRALEHRLARTQAEAIASKPRDEGCAGGPWIQARPPRGSGRARLGPPGWREREPPIGPGAQAVPRHTARLGPHLGRRHTRQHRVRERARDPTTGRQKGRKGRMSLGDARAHAGHGVRDRVETRAAQAVLLQEGHGLVERAGPIFEGGRWAAQLSDEAREHLGHRCARPGIRHRDPNTVDMLPEQGPLACGDGGGRGWPRRRTSSPYPGRC